MPKHSQLTQAAKEKSPKRTINCIIDTGMKHVGNTYKGQWDMTSNLKGIVLKIIAVSIFTAMMALVKITAPYVPTGQQVFFRAFFSMIIIVMWLIARGDLPRGLYTQNPWGHVWRGVFGTAAMSLRFFGLGILAFPEVSALIYSNPLFLTILAALFLGETVRAFRWTTVIIGFAGVLIILWPNLNFSEHDHPLHLIASIGVIASAGLAALAHIQIRKLTQTEGTPQIVFYFSLTTTILALCTLPFGWVIPPLWAAGLLALSGLIGGIGQIALTAAYRAAPASVVAPFEYISMVLAVFIGIFIFDEVPTSYMLIGASVVVASGLIIIWRENRSKTRSA